MLNLMEVTMIKNLVERGASISAIARQMGVDRKTVRKVLQKEQSPQMQHKEAASILDPYKDYLCARLQVAEFTVQRLFQDIQQQGYKGGYDLVKLFVSPLREEKRRQAVIRFETLPGQQAQVDWAGKFGLIEIDGVKKALSCFSMILGFSRYQYIEFTISRNLVNFLGCHIHAFEYFGGVPAEVLYDNLKTAIISNVDGIVEYQSKFSDFAAYYGFTPRACRPYRAQTKGKVERPFQYIRSNFFLGCQFNDLADLNAQARQWLNQTASQRIHGTTYERPIERFEKEKPLLRPLPQQQFRSVQTLFRSSTRDCFISYGGNFYSVPPNCSARKQLRVEVSADQIEIFHRNERIAMHSLCPGKHQRIMDPKHLQGLQPHHSLTPLQKKLQQIRELGPIAQQFLDGLVKSQTRFLPWHVAKLQETLFKVGPELLQQAMERAIRFEAFDARTIQNICRKLRYKAGCAEPLPIGNIISGILLRYDGLYVQGRSLQDYETLCGN